MGLPLHVLFIYDSDDHVAFVVQILRNGGYDVNFKRVDNADLMSPTLYVKKWDVVISEYHLHQFNALAAFILIQLRHPRTPFILVSDSMSADLSIAAAKVGIENHIARDQVAQELVLMVEQVLQERAGPKS